MDVARAIQNAINNPPYPEKSSYLVITVDERGFPKSATIAISKVKYRGKIPEGKRFESFYVAKLGEDNDTVTIALLSSEIRDLARDDKLSQEFVKSVWAFTRRSVTFKDENAKVITKARVPPKVMCLILGVNCYDEKLAGKRLFFPVEEAEAITYEGKVVGVAVTIKKTPASVEE